MNRNRIINEQKGMVSIVVTLIMMIVITLIVIGFAQISRREQRNALDRQLSTQAFYAAESGVNDAVKAINGYINAGKSVPAKTNCPPDGAGGNYPTSNIINSNSFGGSARLQYTCLLINPTPVDQQATPPQGTSTVFALIPTSGTLDTIQVNWQNTGGDTTFTCPQTSGTFTPSSAWNCSLAIYRLDIIPGDSFGSQGSLQSGAITLFLYPQSGAGNISKAITSADNGKIIPIQCTQTGSAAPICNISLALGSKPSFYLRAMPIYEDDNTVKITATSGGIPVTFENGQAIIDSTGKANDVLRRVKIYQDISNTNNSSSQTPYPDFAIQSYNSLCKQLSVFPNNASGNSNDNACVIP